MPTTSLTAGVKEDKFQRDLIGAAQTLGWRVVHFPKVTIRRRGQRMTRTFLLGDPGSPDLLLACPVRGVILAELKSDRGALSPEQKAWRDALSPHVVWVLWRPRDWDTILEVLKNGVYIP